LRRIAVVLLVAGIPAAEAAPLVPSGDLPGRERYRFTPSPLDRFMQPNPPTRPLLRWDCGSRGAWRGKPRSRRKRGRLSQGGAGEKYGALFFRRQSGRTAFSTSAACALLKRPTLWPSF